MSSTEKPGTAASPTKQSLAPTGKLGFRGRSATPEERAQVFEAFFFEGKRRIPYLQQFFTLMALSAAIAAFGLVNDSAAVVIGAMLVAPLMTPILAIAAAIVQGWGQRVVESVAIVGAGALAAIVVGMVVAFMTPALRSDLPLPGELLARTNPNLIDLAIALAAGAAGGFVAVRTEASGALPGVGIAVALVPPLATVGLAAGLGLWDLSLGALLLFVTNLVAIVLAAGLVFVAAGFAAFRDAEGLRQSKLASVIIVVAVIVVGIPLLLHSLQRVEQGDAVAAVARQTTEWAPGMMVTEVIVDRSVDPIEVTIGVTGLEPPPAVAILATRLAEDLNADVNVEVGYIPLTSANALAP